MAGGTAWTLPGPNARGPPVPGVEPRLASDGVELWIAPAGSPVSRIGPTGTHVFSVPGTVDGWFALHGKFGKLPMKRLLAPTIEYANNGFPVTELIAHYWALSVPRLSKYPGFSEQFTRDETMKRAFVRSLEIIGEAVKKAPTWAAQRYPDIDWRAAAGMRDRLIHGYFGVDYDIVWDVVTNKVPVLRSQIAEILQREGGGSPRE